ncbi:bromo-adjacent homology domain-containing protein [Perilla frutescens var. frutescens]|nr:bromo-adjacent homology domain-containing protein [Perilla frutescens var. frutescens]
MEQYKKKKRKRKSEEPEPETASEDDEQEDLEAQPIGKPIRFSGKGRWKRSHFASFEYDGIPYQLEDPVLLVPEKGNQKPYVAIIKDIAQKQESKSMMVTGQWFYRPEEAEKKTGGNWQSRDTRELFYSFHRDEVPAESVMHKCVVHFIPLNKQIPDRKQHPGFIVQKVYDTDMRKLFKLTDKDYEDIKQHEIDLLVEKTFARLGDIPDIEPEDANMDQEDQIKNKRLLRKKNVSPLDVSRDDEGTGKPQLLKAETPGSTPAGASEYYVILANFKMLTGETQRDKWLEKLLQSIQFMCTSVGGKQNDEEQYGGIKDAGSIHKGGVSFDWPDAAVPAVAALEKAAHDALSADFQKYNQKMRQLAFNLKNVVLARRLLNKELEPAQILNMSPNELKEGLTAEEIARREPEETGRMQMTDARCKRCSEKQVGLTDIIQTGHGDRYQLECVACGNSWYASRDDAASLTIEGPSTGKTVGTAPLATAKSEDAEKNLVSPTVVEKGVNDALKKPTEAFLPVLENQRSFNKARPEENLATNKAK